MSTSTEPPAALALSLGAKLDTKGMAVATAATPPAAAVVISQKRRSGSPGLAGTAQGGWVRVWAMLSSLSWK